MSHATDDTPNPVTSDAPEPVRDEFAADPVAVAPAAIEAPAAPAAGPLRSKSSTRRRPG